MKIVLEPNSTFIDVGCHKGEVLSEALKIAPNGFHYGFEPIPDLFDQLTKKYGNTCEIVKIALSSERGTSTFNYVKTNPAYSGILKRNYPGNETIEKIEIDTDTLDNQLHKATRVDLVKIDVEGAEMNVLKGAVKTLEKHNPVIIFEHGLGASDHYGTTPEEMWDFFDSAHYNLYTLKTFVDKRIYLEKKDFVELFNSNKEYYFVARFRA